MKKIFLIISVLFSLHVFAQSDSVIYFKVPIGAGGGSITATGAPDSTYFRIVNSTGRNYRISALGVSSNGTVTSTTTVSAAPVQQLVTTGDVTINNNTNLLIYNNPSTSASVTITLPAIPTDGQTVGIEFINAVTTFALLPNTGQAISQSFVPTTMSAGEFISYTWINSLSKWIAK